MAVGPCSAMFREFPHPSLLPNSGGTSLDTPTASGNEGCASFEAAGRKLEYCFIYPNVAKVEDAVGPRRPIRQAQGEAVRLRRTPNP